MTRKAASVAHRSAPAAAGERRLDRTAIDTIRTLAMDAVEQAKSGHPGTPMALAPAAYTLWQRVLRYDPQDPAWPKDRKSTRLNSSHEWISYAVFCLKKKKKKNTDSLIPKKKKKKKKTK